MSREQAVQDIDSQRVFYNERWNSFQYVNPLKLARCIAILDALSALKLREPRIADLGCGAGWLSAVLGLIGPTTGVDLSDAAVEAASRAFPHVQFLQADVMNWSPPQGRFDVVVSQEVIEHIEDQAGYLRVAHDLLREGGWLILTTPNARTLRAMPEAQQEVWRDQPIENWLTPGELRRLLSERFEVGRLTTIIPGYGARGIYRLMNSVRLRSALRGLGLERSFNSVRLRMGCGLHLLAVARRTPPGRPGARSPREEPDDSR